jgi:rubrerythrin
MELRTINEVFDFAIAAEIEAARTYRDLAGRVSREDLRELLLAIAGEEDAHQKSLEQVREGDLTLFAARPPEVQLSAPLAVPALTPDATPAQILLTAIDAERQAYQLYSNLAAAADDLGLSTLLQSLAAQETRHWQKLQESYDGCIADSPRSERPSPDGSATTS